MGHEQYAMVPTGSARSYPNLILRPDDLQGEKQRPNELNRATVSCVVGIASTMVNSDISVSCLLVNGFPSRRWPLGSILVKSVIGGPYQWIISETISTPYSRERSG